MISFLIFFSGNFVAVLIFKIFFVKKSILSKFPSFLQKKIDRIIKRKILLSWSHKFDNFILPSFLFKASKAQKLFYLCFFKKRKTVYGVF